MTIKRYSLKMDISRGAKVPQEHPHGDLLQVFEIEAATGHHIDYIIKMLSNPLQQIDLGKTPLSNSPGQPKSGDTALVSAPGYEQLVQVLRDAHDQAAYGKGKERHANNLPFHKQRMQQISEMLNSPDGMTYQVMKKVTEGLAMPELDRKVTELLGAINYLAGIVIFLRNRDGVKVDEPVVAAEATPDWLVGKGWVPTEHGTWELDRLRRKKVISHSFADAVSFQLHIDDSL